MNRNGATGHVDWRNKKKSEMLKGIPGTNIYTLPLTVARSKEQAAAQ